MERKMKETKWLVQAKKADFNALAEKYHIDPVTARLIRNRGHESESDYDLYLNGNEENLHSPWLFKDMQTAVEIMMEKIRLGKKIRVIGDYDIDGVCSTYILVDALTKAGAEVSMAIPDRVKDGYGINEHLIEVAYEQGVDTIITCDNGIAAVEQIAYAKKLGMTVIVTDHHEIPYMETEQGREFLRVQADAVINPKQPDCPYPFKLLCGGAVAYKFVQALFAGMGKIEDKASVILEEYIEFAAIATIGDVVDLYGENRILAKLGLKYLQNSKNIGIQALREAAGLEDKKISSYHIGFVLGPCLNASGRLETAKESFELLNTREPELAKKRAMRLKELNDRRKELTEEGVELAMERAMGYPDDKVLVLYLPEVHESIAGIIAGRVREKVYKPVLVLTKAEEGVKGSGRSIEAYHMFEELTKCRELFLKYGGHAMAAGLSLEEENVDILRKRLNEQTTLTEEQLVPKIWIDVPMPLHYIRSDLILELEKLEPFGKGNEKPVFAEKNVKIQRMSVIGKAENSLKFTLVNAAGFSMTALYFNQAEEFLQDMEEKFGREEVKKATRGLQNALTISIIYYPQINEYNGFRENQIIINHYC